MKLFGFEFRRVSNQVGDGSIYLGGVGDALLYHFVRFGLCILVALFLWPYLMSPVQRLLVYFSAPLVGLYWVVRDSLRFKLESERRREQRILERLEAQKKSENINFQ